jgi:hypothetical protein
MEPRISDEMTDKPAPNNPREIEKIKPVKVKSLQTLAMKAALKNPRQLITEPLPLQLGLMAHEPLKHSLLHNKLEIKKSLYEKLISKNTYTEYKGTVSGTLMARRLAGEEFSKICQNLPLSQLCLLLAIETEHIKQQKLELTVNEALVYNYLSSEFKAAIDQLVIHPSLLQKLLASCKRQLWEIL